MFPARPAARSTPGAGRWCSHKLVYPQVYPQEEDFGIVAVEAQAAGRPVIAFGRGGNLDTVRPTGAPGSNEQPSAFASGVYFDRQTPEALVAALQEFESQADKFHPKRIREWSRQFGIDRFRAEFRQEVETALEDHRLSRRLR